MWITVYKCTEKKRKNQYKFEILKREQRGKNKMLETLRNQNRVFLYIDPS